MRVADFICEYWSCGLVVALFSFIGMLMFNQYRNWPAEFVRSNAGDQHIFRGTVVNLGEVESYKWYYHWSTYDKRLDEPKPPSIGRVMWPDDHSNILRLKILPIQLDGANQGYAGMATRINEDIPYGSRVVCGLGRVYYPTRNRSKFAFWLECKLEGDTRPLRPIHDCPTWNEHNILITCPDDEEYNRRRGSRQWLF